MTLPTSYRIPRPFPLNFVWFMPSIAIPASSTVPNSTIPYPRELIAPVDHRGRDRVVHGKAEQRRVVRHPGKVAHIHPVTRKILDHTAVAAPYRAFVYPMPPKLPPFIGRDLRSAGWSAIDVQQRSELVAQLLASSARAKSTSAHPFTTVTVFLQVHVHHVADLGALEEVHQVPDVVLKFSCPRRPSCTSSLPSWVALGGISQPTSGSAGTRPAHRFGRSLVARRAPRRRNRPLVRSPRFGPPPAAGL